MRIAHMLPAAGPRSRGRWRLASSGADRREELEQEAAVERLLAVTVADRSERGVALLLGRCRSGGLDRLRGPRAQVRQLPSDLVGVDVVVLASRSLPARDRRAPGRSTRSPRRCTVSPSRRSSTAHGSGGRVLAASAGSRRSRAGPGSANEGPRPRRRLRLGRGSRRRRDGLAGADAVRGHGSASSVTPARPDSTSSFTRRDTGTSLSSRRSPRSLTVLPAAIAVIERQRSRSTVTSLAGSSSTSATQLDSDGTTDSIRRHSARSASASARSGSTSAATSGWGWHDLGVEGERAVVRAEQLEQALDRPVGVGRGVDGRRCRRPRPRRRRRRGRPRCAGDRSSWSKREGAARPAERMCPGFLAVPLLVLRHVSPGSPRLPRVLLLVGRSRAELQPFSPSGRA